MKRFLVFLRVGVPFIILLLTTLFQSPSFVYADCTGALSFCSLKPLPAGAKPGSTCADGNGNYVYGVSGNCGPGQNGTCIPHCGFGDAYCCDPKPGYVPPNSSLPGCTTRNSQGGCANVNTALGPIATDPGGIVKSAMGILLSLSGGVAILLIIAAGYQLTVSRGNPEKVKEARERLTAAIVGLLFIIFSVAILQIIGIDLLHIPGLSR